MYKYEVGDVVVVADLRDINQKNKRPVFVDEMEKYCGKVFTVGKRFSVFDYEPCYRLVGNDYSWREDWLKSPNNINVDEFINFLLTQRGGKNEEGEKSNAPDCD